jgi:hypothetical protein
MSDMEVLMLEEEGGRILEQMAQIKLVPGNILSIKICRWRKLMFTNNLLRKSILFYKAERLRLLSNMHIPDLWQNNIIITKKLN